jgi:hypothetical protein
MICKRRYKDYDRFCTILDKIQLNDTNKEIIRLRYLPILKTLQRRAANYSILYYTGHIIITVGSLFVPALLSIQYADTTNNDSFNKAFQIQIFWTTWVISLLVTIFNGVLTLFKIDKKYYFLNTMLERIRSEGWQYIQLTGRYSGHLINHNIPTHENQYVFFSHRIEKFKMKQVAEEYFKSEDRKSEEPANAQKNSYSITQMYSPDQPLQNMQDNIPLPVREAVTSLIKSRRTIKSIDSNKSSITTKSIESSSNNSTITEGDINEIIILDKDETIYNDFVEKK